MNKRIGPFYVIVSDNKVISFGNLQDTLQGFDSIDYSKKFYMRYYRKFKKSDNFTEVIEGKTYYFQRLI